MGLRKYKKHDQLYVTPCIILSESLCMCVYMFIYSYIKKLDLQDTYTQKHSIQERSIQISFLDEKLCIQNENTTVLKNLVLHSKKHYMTKKKKRIWCALNGHCTIGPIFYDGTNNYAAVLSKSTVSAYN